MKTIAEKYNKFFTEIGLNFAKDIDPSSVTFSVNLTFYLTDFYVIIKSNETKSLEINKDIYSYAEIRAKFQFETYFDLVILTLT